MSTRTDVLVLMRNTRSSRVLVEVFGDRYSGILNSDCFSAYEKYEADEYQKCWAHILLDGENLAKHNDEGRKLYQELSRMYKYITKTKENKKENAKNVKFWIWRQKKIIASWASKSYESKAVLNLVKRINKYLDQWFTCLKYDFVEPTNNAREREIRKNVIARKVSGCHRSEKGKRAREIMMSNILTIQKIGENPFEFISNTIKNYNSGIVKIGV
ncbi:MAG: transposase [Candidatus Aenigmatarchaeota archaeon]